MNLVQKHDQLLETLKKFFYSKISQLLIIKKSTNILALSKNPLTTNRHTRAVRTRSRRSSTWLSRPRGLSCRGSRTWCSCRPGCCRRCTWPARTRTGVARVGKLSRQRRISHHTICCPSTYEDVKLCLLIFLLL